MEYAKYIIVNNPDKLLTEDAFLFPPSYEHKAVANGFDVVAAGFFSTCTENRDIDVATWGMSTSLNLASRYEDAIIIKRVLIGRN